LIMIPVVHQGVLVPCLPTSFADFTEMVLSFDFTKAYLSRVSVEAPTVICELQYGSLANKSFVLKAHRVHRSILHWGRDRLLFDLLKGESTNAAAELWVCNQ
jgi:hypothetical protein